MKTPFVRILNCVSKPTAQQATQMLIRSLTAATFNQRDVMISVSRLIQHLRARPGDLSWTITVLSTLKEQAKIDCPIFDLDYVAPPRHTKQAQADAGLS